MDCPPACYFTEWSTGNRKFIWSGLITKPTHKDMFGNRAHSICDLMQSYTY